MKNKFFKKNFPSLSKQLKLLWKVKVFSALGDTFLKTSWKEAQYRIIFYVAPWPMRPYEVDFFEKISEFWDPTCPKIVRKRQTLVRTGPQATVLGISKCKIDRRRSRNVMEPLQTPKTAIKK